jgi:hypothetical protein
MQPEARYDISIKVAANVYGVTGNWPTFYYDGTNVTKAEFEKKFELRDSLDELIPSDKYTYEWTDVKNLGYYTLEIKFNDPKYPESMFAGFDVILKAPKLTKATGGKKKLTVKWNKLSKAQLSKTYCMYIELATNKSFTKGFKRIKVSSAYLKKHRSKTIKKLTGGKKYYVRTYLCSTKLSDEFGSYRSYSYDSNIKSAKVKK